MATDRSSARVDSITIFETEDGKTRVEVRFEQDNVWLTQKLMAELYECTADNISLHLKNWTVLDFPRPPFGGPPAGHHSGGMSELIS